jgi:SNF2 family DNA or RNA helicase
MYTCKVANGEVSFFLGGTPLDLSASEIYKLIQTEEFGGDRTVMASPAQVGLRVESSPPLSEIQLIAKPRQGKWVNANSSSTWIDDGVRLAYLPEFLRNSVRDRLAELTVSIGEIEFRETPRVVTQLGDEFYIEVIEPKWRDYQTPTDEATKTPRHSLTVELHEYQKWSVSRLTQFCAAGIGAVLADEMGLGKTLQSIAVILEMVNRGGQALVVVPPVLIPNWRREFANFAPTLRIGIHHRSSNLEVEPDEFKNYDVVLTAYSTLTSVQGDAHILNLNSWALTVIDEAQFIKNPDAKRSVATKEINRKSSLALSGTPVENSPLDLWSLAEFVFPQLLGAREDFDTDIHVNDVALERVRTLLRPMIIRRTLSDVADDFVLPDRVEKFEYLELSAEASQVQAEIVASAANSQSRFSNLLLLAAEAHKDGDYQSFVASPKYVRLEMLINNALANDEKLIVFCRYKATLDFLGQAIAHAFPKVYCATIRGDSGTPEMRQSIVDEFSGSTNGVLLLNPDAAGYGLNITAASIVVHFHPLWNPAKTDQATKRAHRPGQTRVTKVHHLVYEASVEEAIVERSTAKRELSRRLLGGEDVEVAVPSVTDLLKVVEGYKN